MYIDTDVVIRFLTGDDPKKQKAAAALLEKVDKGGLVLQAPDLVIADAVYVLSSPRLYHLSRPEIRDILSPLVGLSGFKVENKQALLEALNLYSVSAVDFSDAFLIAKVRHSDKKMLYSYDHDFDNLDGITRIQP